MQIEPFTISISESLIEDLHHRLTNTRLPDQIEDIGWEQGTDRTYFQDLVSYWLNAFSWRAQEAALNRLPQFVATIQGQRIHFVHIRAKSGHGIPLIITHGWPGTFAEMVNILPLLIDLGSDGGNTKDAFDVVLPSLPGYGFSSAPRKACMDTFGVAGLWAD